MRLIDIESEAFLKEMREKQNAVLNVINESDGDEKTWTARGHWQGVYGSFVEIALTLKAQPIVEAVPLDKLCEWLNKNQGELPHCPFDDDCYECGLDGVACIKKRIKAWMEGLDAEVH